MKISFLVTTLCLALAPSAFADVIAIPLSSSEGTCPSSIQVYRRFEESGHHYTADLKSLMESRTTLSIANDSIHRFEAKLNSGRFPGCTASGTVMVENGLRFSVTIFGGAFYYEVSTYSGFSGPFPVGTGIFEGSVVNNQAITLIGHAG